MEAIHKIQVNDKEWKHVGEPLMACVSDGERRTGHVGNFLPPNTEKADSVVFKNLHHAFQWVRDKEKEFPYHPFYTVGYILDFDTKTVFYDAEDGLKMLKYSTFPGLGIDEYFKNFVQVNFAEIK